MRYDTNLVAERQHIECNNTYRVTFDISQISQEIYIAAVQSTAIYGGVKVSTGIKKVMKQVVVARQP